MHSTNADTIPTILAIETSGTVCSVCLVQGQTLRAEYTLDIPNLSDRMLATLVRRILDETACLPESLSAVAVSSGPGSFTGLRIGFAFAKGFCLASDIAFIPVPTLEACVHAAIPIASILPDCDIAAVLPARDDWWYVQHFSSTGTALTNPLMVSGAELAGRITPQTLLCGSGAASIRKGIHVPGLERLTARFVARCGLHWYHAGRTANPSTAVPLYVEEFVPRTAAQSHSL
jgi:tRNA threonylcarbamoyladenosine biosynthesis protein TsaB